VVSAPDKCPHPECSAMHQRQLMKLDLVLGQPLRWLRPVLLQKGTEVARRRWQTPVIPAIQEAEIRRIEVRGQPGQIVQETLS
jgi:hypothetical protein